MVSTMAAVATVVVAAEKVERVEMGAAAVAAWAMARAAEARV